LRYYKNACLARRITYDHKEWFDGLKEHWTFKMPRTIRTFFTLILMYGEPVDPKLLLEEYKKGLVEDFVSAAKRNGTPIDEAVKKAYRIIANTLNNEAPEGRRFDYWIQMSHMDPVPYYEEEQYLSDQSREKSK
jgi:hypothetical protein